MKRVDARIAELRAECDRLQQELRQMEAARHVARRKLHDVRHGMIMEHNGEPPAAMKDVVDCGYRFESKDSVSPGVFKHLERPRDWRQYETES